jgi:hypothetical protein
MWDGEHQFGKQKAQKRTKQELLTWNISLKQKGKRPNEPIVVFVTFTFLD